MSKMYRVRLWLRNPRNFLVLGGASASFIAIIKACPLLLPNQLYRPIMEAYKGGKKLKPTAAQLQEFDDVCKELRIRSECFHPFATSRWDLKVKGLPLFPSGVIFGFPVQFVDEPQLNRSKFSDNIKVNLSSEEGESFKQSMKPSDKARRFALAKEVAYADKCYAAYPLILAPGTVAAAFTTTFVLQVSAGIFPLFVTGFLVGCTFLASYRYLTGALNEKHDLRTDDIVGSLGQSYVEGGLEFYEKSLQRNRSLRKLLGAKGEKLYTYYGNRTAGILWSSGAPLTVKRDYFQKLLKATQSQESKES